jgi:hypothetical protein
LVLLRLRRLLIILSADKVNNYKGLKRKGPDELLPELRTLSASHPEIATLPGWLAYLEKREAHMQYPVYQAQGLPIASGAVESGNKLVVEARLKGSGMHWAREHVNPMLGLRNAACSDRWDEAWSQISGYRQQQARQRPHTHREQRLAAVTAAVSDAETSVADAVPLPVTLEPATAPVLPAMVAATQSQPRQPWRPPPDHPWRRYPACSSRRRTHFPDARK